MLKCGFRKLHFYPLMFLLFAVLRKTVETILRCQTYADYLDFLIPLLIFFSQCLFGLVIYLCYSKKNISRSSSKAIVLSPFNNEPFLLLTDKSSLSDDGKIKIICLIIFASFFNAIGTFIRNEDLLKPMTKEEDNGQLDFRVRGIQIIFSSLLCYYTIRINIYKHQKLSLIVISVFYAILIGVELYISDEILVKMLILSICIISNLFRSFMDVTEKYLFEYNYINIFLMLIYEGLTGLFFLIMAFFMSPVFGNEGKNLLNYLSESSSELIIFIVLIVAYIIISGFKNAYRVTTNKYYSPISRALIESTIDPILFLYNSLSFREKDDYKLFWAHFAFVLLCLMIIAFFALIYNDFIILYCCGLEYNTYSEITNRLYSEELNKDGIFSDDDIASFSSLNSEDEKSINIELNGDYIIRI